MSERDHLIFEGTIEKVCGGGFYEVHYKACVESPVIVALCKLGGRLKHHHIRVIPGDLVRVAVSPHDPTQGMITFRK